MGKIPESKVNDILDSVGMRTGRCLVLVRMYTPNHPQYIYIDLVRLQTNSQVGSYDDDFELLGYFADALIETGKRTVHVLKDDTRVTVSCEKVLFDGQKFSQEGYAIVFIMSLDKSDKKWVHDRLWKRNRIGRLAKLAFEHY